MIQSALLVTLAWLIINGVDRLMSWQTFARPIVTAAITGLVLAIREKRPGRLIPLAATCVPGIVYLAIYAAVVFL